MFRTPDFSTGSELYELTDRRTRFEVAEQDTKIEESKEERIASRDAADLARLGKRQVLKVRCHIRESSFDGSLTTNSETSHTYLF